MPIRDEAEFLSRLSAGGGRTMRHYADSNERLLISEGDQACAWIDGRPGGPYDESESRGEYRSETEPIASIPHDGDGVDFRGFVAVTAWHTLCFPELQPVTGD
jgi:hypothetical protein